METDGRTHPAEETAAATIRFAEERLGPSSARLLAHADVQALLRSRLRDGRSLPDAVLGLVHERARSDRSVADEFLAYFLDELVRSQRVSLAPALRRYLETGDLVQSVAKDVWEDLARVEFESRAGFIALLAQRLRWKTLDKARAARRDKRGEDRRVDLDLVERPLPDPAASPATRLELREQSERMVLALLRLSERDRTILRLYLAGASTAALAKALGIREEAARRARARAIERARDHLRPRLEPPVDAEVDAEVDSEHGRRPER